MAVHEARLGPLTVPSTEIKPNRSNHFFGKARFMYEARRSTRLLARFPLISTPGRRPDQRQEFSAPGSRMLDHAAQSTSYPLIQRFQRALYIDEGKVAGPAPQDRAQFFNDSSDVALPATLEDLTDTQQSAEHITGFG